MLHGLGWFLCLPKKLAKVAFPSNLYHKLGGWRFLFHCIFILFFHLSGGWSFFFFFFKFLFVFVSLHTKFYICQKLSMPPDILMVCNIRKKKKRNITKTGHHNHNVSFELNLELVQQRITDVLITSQIGFQVTSYQATFASHHISDCHFGFLWAQHGNGNNKMSCYFMDAVLFCLLFVPPAAFFGGHSSFALILLVLLRV